MALLGYAFGMSFFSNTSLVAGTIAGVCATITAVVTLTRSMRIHRRRDRARLLQVGWQGSTNLDEVGAMLLNESAQSFKDVVLTVGCGLHGREAHRERGVFAGNEQLLFTSRDVHTEIAGRIGNNGPDEDETHQSKPHGVQVTFGDGKGYWYRDDGDVQRIDALVVWAEKTRAATLRRYFAHRSPFHKSYAINVVVESFERTEELEHGFTGLAESGDPPRGHHVPDVVVGPHDWIGRVVRDDSVTEPQFTRGRLRQFEPAAVEALSRHDQLYALPYAFDTVALIRNNALAGPGTMPSTFDELLADAAKVLGAKNIPDGVGLALQVGRPDAHGNAGDPYHVWPLLSSCGASFFGLAGTESGGRQRFDDIERWRDGFVAAFARLAELGVGPGGSGVLNPAVGRAEALPLFLAGRAPYLVCSSRALASIRRQRMDVTVGAVPRLGSGPAVPMVSVYGMFIYHDAPHLPAARDLLSSYVSQPAAGLTLNRFQQLVPVQQEAGSIIADRDPVLRPYIEQCRTGMIMPSYPEMRAAWQLLGRTEYEVLAGTGETPETLAERAAERGWELLAEARGA